MVTNSFFNVIEKLILNNVDVKIFYPWLIPPSHHYLKDFIDVVGIEIQRQGYLMPQKKLLKFYVNGIVSLLPSPNFQIGFILFFVY